MRSCLAFTEVQTAMESEAQWLAMLQVNAQEVLLPLRVQKAHDTATSIKNTTEYVHFQVGILP